MRRGDVFTVSMRGPAGKPRPGVIVQADELIRADHAVLVCPLTSDLIPDLLTRPQIEPGVENGLLRHSQAMVDHITAAVPREIGIVVGRLNDDEMRRIDDALMLVFGLMRHLATQTSGRTDR